MAVFHGTDTVPPQELRIDCKFPCQAAAKRAPCSILSVCNNFVHRPTGICPAPTNSFFQMKILNKLADVDVFVCGYNLLKDRRLWRFALNSAHSNSHEKVGEWARFRCCNALLFNHFPKYRACQLVRKMELRTQWKYCLGHECLNQKMLSLHRNGIQRHRRLTELVQRHYNLS